MVICSSQREAEVVREVANQTVNLFTAKGISKTKAERFVASLDKEISEEQRNELDEEISDFEVERAIKSSQKGKTPGSAGLPI